MILKAQKGRGKKIHILLDDEYKITTDAEFWSYNFIPNGTEIDEKDFEELASKINYQKAFNKCASLLATRNHSEKELYNKVIRTADEESATRAVEKFKEMGYLDDEKFANELAKYLFEIKRYSSNNVRQELFKRGVDREIVLNVIDELDVDETDQIISVINKKYTEKLSKDGGKEKVIAALMRKGFSYGDIKSAFYKIENE